MNGDDTIVLKTSFGDNLIDGGTGSDTVDFSALSGYTQSYTTTKTPTGVEIDLKADSGRETFLRLARSADVVIESFRPGVLDRLGIGWDATSARNPRLVYCSTSGFGQSGPRSQWAGHDLNIEAGDNTAAAMAHVVVLATPWDSAAPTATSVAEHLAGKVVISMANALVRLGPEFHPLVPPRGSVAAHVQAAVPRTRVVAAFHHLPAKELGHLGEPIDSDVLICGDDVNAVRAVSEIVSRIPGCRPLDAGELSNATAIEAFTAVLLQLNVRYKTRVAPKLNGIRRDPQQPAT